MIDLAVQSPVQSPPPLESTPPTRSRRSARRSWLTPRNTPYVLLAPVILLFAAFKGYPILSAAYLSLTTNDGGTQRLVGIANYERIFNDPLFYRALLNTLVILVIQVPIMLALAMLLAVAFHSTLLKFRTVFRLGYFLPVVMGLVAYGVIFSVMLATDNGIVNVTLQSIGLPKVPWLQDPVWAKVSLMIAMTWHYTGINTVIYLAQRQTIPQDLYEAAAMDGAGHVRQFFNVTLPGLRPAILLTVVTSTIGTLQLFDEPYILTNGGPDNATLTIGMYLYENAFTYFDFGYASAIGFVLVGMVVILSVAQFRLFKEEK
ncbi:sugar ABC transporter permease [Agromyces sp. SYSU K20354]|uniref:carbohydrate ABC transporter permease n=1 Tax=Agromyces cavernae TaxID=2898659 RepID=UPI001E3451AA|nr:sugar ABC transporter permease [Agromyces cavernae]MCD2443378.1 sugar ABC transporter permease [Agromyces cavernae]